MSVLLATAGYDCTIRLYDAASGDLIRSFSHSDKQSSCLTISPDKNFIVSGSNPHIRLYDVNGKTSDPLVTYEGHTSNVTSIGYQRDGRWLYSGSEDGTIRIWDTRVSGPQREYDVGSPVNSAVLHPNQGEIISGDRSGSVRVWDLASGTCSAELTPESDTPISSVAIASDASIVTAGNYNGSLYFWQPQSSEKYIPLSRIQAHKAYVLSVKISPDTLSIATASSDHTVKIWERTTSASEYSYARTLQGHTKWVWDTVFSADSNYLVSASSDATARLWEVSSGNVVRVYSGHNRGITACTLADEIEGGGGEPSNGSGNKF